MVTRRIFSRLFHCCCIGAAFAFVSTPTAAPPRLSRCEAVRIANDRARQVLHRDYVRPFRIYFADYLPAQRTWRVNYRSAKNPALVFFVEVSDSTREATVSQP
jgi:hypothetical protein